MTTETLKETLVFEREKETRNTYRNREVSELDPPMLGTIYIQKQVLGDNPPERLTVTVQAVEEGA